jgi:hypothetical protein
MQLSTILLGSFLAIMLLCNMCTSNDDVDNPVRACLLDILAGNQHKCFSKFVASYEKHQDWSEDKPLKICKNKCTVSGKGRFFNSEWVWEARVRCNSKLPSIVGNATMKSRNGAQHWAIDDLINKAVATGRFKRKEFECKQKN